MITTLCFSPAIISANRLPTRGIHSRNHDHDFRALHYPLHRVGFALQKEGPLVQV